MINNSNCLTLDSDFSDELIINEENEEFKRSNYSSSEEEEEYIFYKPAAPPPSPQEPSMLEAIFKENNKPAVFKEERGFMDHAQTLDKLLRKTLNQQQNSNKICKKRRTSWTATLEKQQKFKSIMKAAAGSADKLKKALMIDEETSLVIHELREMGL
ncbi:hypothetical protein BY458DRAFT_504428 [Sporodiniella umbellata]|nr:hypothetical protein BY458DRAFT_504428 [Sporodiniella umbellata]